MFSRGAKYTSKVARTDIQFINRITMMTRVEIWGLEWGWKEIEKVHELFRKRIFGVPSTAANTACVREIGRTNRKEKVAERIVKYCKRLWKMDETSLLREALKQQSI
jgi:hypothetical protein